MAVWTCEACGRKISARQEVKICGECRLAGKKKTVRSPEDKMIREAEIKSK